MHISSISSVLGHMLQVLHLDVLKVDQVLQIISLPPCFQLPRLGVSTFSRRRLGIRTRGAGGCAPSPSSLCWRRVVGWRRGWERAAASSASGCSYSVVPLRERVGAPSVTLFCGSIAEIGRLLSIERVGRPGASYPVLLSKRGMDAQILSARLQAITLF
jgi:hypothetical protein